MDFVITILINLHEWKGLILGSIPSYSHTFKKNHFS